MSTTQTNAKAQSPQLAETDLLPTVAEETWQDVLTAYLDGELDVHSSRQVEQRLAIDAQARQDLQQLEAVWDALDQLPRSAADHDFTKTTVDLVAQVAEEDLQQATAAIPRRRARQRLWSVGAFCGIALIAFLVVRLSWPDPDRALIINLPLLVRMDEYQLIEHIQFLEELDRRGLFTPDEQPPLKNVLPPRRPTRPAQAGRQNGQPAPEQSSQAQESQVQESQVQESQVQESQTQSVLGEPVPEGSGADGQQSAVGGIPEEILQGRVEASSLSSEDWAVRREFVSALDPAAKDRLARQLKWFLEHPDQQAELRQLHRSLADHPDSDRLTEIMQLYVEWFQDLPEHRQRELKTHSREQRLNRLWRLDRIELARVLRVASALGRMRGPFPRFPGRQLPESALTELRKSLSEETRERLEQIAPKDSAAQLQLLRAWVEFSLTWQLRHFRRPTADKLEELFLSLPAEKQRELEQRSPQDVKDHLTEIYRSRSRPNQGRPNQGRPNQGRSNQGRSNQGWPNQSWWNQGWRKHGRPKPETSKPDAPNHPGSNNQESNYQGSNNQGSNWGEPGQLPSFRPGAGRFPGSARADLPWWEGMPWFSRR